MLGKLSWDVIPLDEPIAMAASMVMVCGILGLLAYVFWKGWFPYLWREWITSVDHKRIGVMYCLLASVMLLRGFSDAIMMRSQQALAYNSPGYLPPEHYDQVFSAHGTIMIFFVAMPFMIGLMNFVMPLQLGVRDVAFPTLNSVSFWLTASGVLLINLSLFIGEFARTTWLPYPPLSELKYSPGVGVDYYLWGLQISGVGTLMSGINLVTTVLQDQGARNEPSADADVLLDDIGVEPADRRGVPDPDGNARDADPRSLSGVPFLHKRRWGEHDDVYEPHLDLGTSRGLHPHPSRFRCLFRGDLDFFG